MEDYQDKGPEIIKLKIRVNGLHNRIEAQNSQFKYIESRFKSLFNMFGNLERSLITLVRKVAGNEALVKEALKLLTELNEEKKLFAFIAEMTKGKDSNYYDSINNDSKEWPEDVKELISKINDKR